MEEKRKRLLGAGLLWALGKGMENPQYHCDNSKALVGLTMEKDKNDVTLAADMEGDYIFTYTISTKKLTITFPSILSAMLLLDILNSH